LEKLLEKNYQVKISIITIVKNNESGVARALASVRNQTFNNVEHIVIDGMSTDKTWDIISKNASDKVVAIRESDNGIYDALNKGIKLSSGKIIGILHSDDCFNDNRVLEDIERIFEKKNSDLVYGDLIYVSKKNPEKVVRTWRAKDYKSKILQKGWMPPHPTIFMSSELYKRIGLYDAKYRISADYKMVLNIFSIPNIAWSYIPRPLVRMSLGGVSNRNLKSIILKSKEDYQILKECQIGGLYTVLLKNFSKISQFF